MQPDDDKPKPQGNFSFDKFMTSNGLEHLSKPNLPPAPAPRRVPRRNPTPPPEISEEELEQILRIIEYIEAHAEPGAERKKPPLPRNSRQFIEALSQVLDTAGSNALRHREDLHKFMYLFGYLDAMSAMGYMQSEQGLTGVEALQWVYNFWKNKLIPWGYDKSSPDYESRPHLGYNSVSFLPGEDDALELDDERFMDTGQSFDISHFPEDEDLDGQDLDGPEPFGPRA